MCPFLNSRVKCFIIRPNPYCSTVYPSGYRIMLTLARLPGTLGSAKAKEMTISKRATRARMQ